MKNKFKQILSAILAAVIVFCAGTTGTHYYKFSGKADKNPQAVSIKEFCLKINEFNRNYKSAESNAQVIDGNTLFNAYENRLLVKTETPLISNAADNVYYDDIAVLQYNDRETMENDFENLKAQGLSVSKDHVYYACTDTTEKAINYSGIDKNYAYADSGAAYARNMFTDNTFNEITVAVVDTGMDYNHEVFEGRYIENSINFSTSGAPDDPMDDQGHGTCTSSIIVMSTPSNVKVKPYKVLSADGGCTASQIVAACEYMLAEENKPDIVNMSLGGYDLLNFEGDIEKHAIAKLIDAGITVCAAAGNESVSADLASPASFDGVITVSSHGANFVFSDYSDYGNCVDICAPGEKVTAAKLGGGTTSELSGTSFSAPFASAACTYILMQHPDFTPAEIKEKLKSTAVKPSKYDELYFGSGILSFANIIEDKEFEAPKPSAAAGIYHEEQTISFEVPEGYSLVYKTNDLNAMTPSVNSTVYSEPITVGSDLIITYALVKDGKYVSPIESAEYEIQYFADENDFVMSGNEIKEYTGGKKNIIVPDTINGVKPRSYTDKTHTYTHIVFPDSVREIGSHAFSANKKLRTITAHGVYSLDGKNNFYNCEYLHKADMPQLEFVTEGAFSGCKRLHSIDFDKNITQLKSKLFMDSGLIKLNLPNAEIDPSSNESVFSSAQLFECCAPKISDFGKNMFYGCQFLYKYEFDEIKVLHDSSVYNCQFLMNLDVSTVEQLYSNALHGCLINHFYAPNIINFEEGSGVFGSYCYCDILDLPNFEGVLSAETLHNSLLESIYLDKVETMDSNALKNMAHLKIVYLPKLTNFYPPDTKKSTILGITIPNPCAELPSPEIIWIPNATGMGALDVEDLGFVFAPKLNRGDVGIHNKDTEAVIIINKPLTSTSMHFFCMASNASFTKKPLLVTESSIETSADAKYNTALHDDFTFTQQNESSFEYICKDYHIQLPFDLAERAWKDEDINKNTDDSENIFIFDFTNDQIINARDFAVYSKAIYNSSKL